MNEIWHDAQQAGHRHEVRDVQVRPIAMLAIGLVMLTGVVLLLMGWLFNHFAARQAKLDVPPSPLAVTREGPPGPRLEVTLDQVLGQVRADEAALLHSYGWVDQQAGIVRIPIDRAMTLLTERGLPVRAEERGAKIEDQGK
jgi:hypothetical protein